MKPLIGLPGCRTTGERFKDNLPVLDSQDIEIYFAFYARAVVEAGGLPMYLPFDADPTDVIERLDGVLLTGGADMNPALYGQAIDGSIDIEDQRDQLELRLLDDALEQEVPVLGICRGLQVINVHAGGTLHQHVPAHAHLDDDGAKIAHEVYFEPTSTMGNIYGETQLVNSLHHQSVNALGENLAVTGRAPDGSVEAIERTDAPVIAVQWHPEILPTRPTDPVFRWLVESAGNEPTPSTPLG